MLPFPSLYQHGPHSNQAMNELIKAVVVPKHWSRKAHLVPSLFFQNLLTAKPIRTTSTFLKPLTLDHQQWILVSASRDAG